MDTKEEQQDFLIPEKYTQGDLFVCDVADAVLKDIMPQMEHPFYSLSKKPDMNIRKYEHNGNWIEIIPSRYGLATIYDKDILIYAISQLMVKLNKKIPEPISQKIRLSARELLVFINRGSSGKDYKAISDALFRLDGTRIRTNVKAGKEEQTDTFGLIDSTSIRRKDGSDGRLLWIELKISDWVFNAIKAKDVLTLNRDYFRLRKPIERRIYELARKHCGRKPKWSISLEILHKKSGSRSLLKMFRSNLKVICKNNHLPDYTFTYDKEKDTVTFFNRVKWWKDSSGKTKSPNDLSISPSAIEEAKKAAPNYDVYFLEQEFRSWMDAKEKTPDNINAAFVGFCKKTNARKPSP